MAQCPSCSAEIDIEIEQYGGECPNCFVSIEGSIGGCAEFEPTGMFTREQLQALVGDMNDAPPFGSENTEELLTDEVDLDDVLVFEDDVTEILERTEPIEPAVVTPDPAAVIAEDEDSDFDFDDEPTIALNPVEEESSLGGIEGSDTHSEPEIAIAQPTPNSGVVVSDAVPEPIQESGASSTVEILQGEAIEEDEESSEELLGGDFQAEGDTIQGMGGIGISPAAERESANETQSTRGLQPLPKSKKSFDWKPVAGTIFIIALAGAIIFGKSEEQTVSKNEAVENAYIPEVQTGHLDKPEPTNVKEDSVKSTSKSTTTKKKTPTVVETSGVRTFQTSRPVVGTQTPSTTGSSSGSSAQLEQDVNKLKKSLKYCHTKALKNDPTVSGKWEVQFRVQNGSASDIRIKAMRTANKEIEQCMDTKIQRFGFTDGPKQNFKFRILFER